MIRCLLSARAVTSTLAIASGDPPGVNRVPDASK
jgi:hypothetical protein